MADQTQILTLSWRVGHVLDYRSHLPASQRRLPLLGRSTTIGNGSLGKLAGLTGWPSRSKTGRDTAYCHVKHASLVRREFATTTLLVASAST